MPIIKLTTIIYAPVAKCFDLARSIDIHVDSMKHTNEKAVAGKTEGLIGLNEWVTWQARHFGITMGMTVEITEFNFPVFFVDEMVKGPFKSMRHYHSFKEVKGETTMADEFHFQSPLGILGNIADAVFLESYMTRLLTKRNRLIKEMAESHH